MRRAIGRGGLARRRRPRHRRRTAARPHRRRDSRDRTRSARHSSSTKVGRLGAGRARCEAKATSNAQQKRPPTLDSRDNRIDDHSEQQPPDAECNRGSTGGDERPDPPGEGDRRRQRIERHHEGRRRPSRAEKAERRDLCDALNEHDTRGEERDDLIEREETRDEREYADHEQRDVRDILARMKPGENRQKRAVARGCKRNPREAEQVAVERGECGHEHEQRDDDGSAVSPGLLDDEGADVLRLRRRLAVRVEQRLPRYGAEHAELQQHVERRNERGWREDCEGNRPVRAHDFIAEQRGIGVAGVIVERNIECAAETGKKARTKTRPGGVEMKCLSEVRVRQAGQCDEKERQHGGGCERRATRRHLRRSPIEEQQRDECRSLPRRRRVRRRWSRLRGREAPRSLRSRYSR